MYLPRGSEPDPDPDDDGTLELTEEREEMRNEPNRSVYNLVYDEDEDEDNISHSTRSYLEADDLPLPVISDSESSVWSRCGQCCDCCDTCLRKRKLVPRCKCKRAKNVLYYVTINILMGMFFIFVIYMMQLNYYQNPDAPPFKQLKFKDDQYPGLTMIPSMADRKEIPISVIWYGTKRNKSNSNYRGNSYVKKISRVLYDHRKACKTGKVCNLDMTSLGPCTTSDYGYKDKTPCIYLGLNRLELWMPEEYFDKSEIPEDVPGELWPNIDVKSARIWVNCKGETDYDQQRIGKIEYFPGPYFNSSFFPLSTQKDTNPIIAIRLKEIKTGYIVKLVCGLYAKNVNKHDAYHTYIYIKD